MYSIDKIQVKKYYKLIFYIQASHLIVTDLPCDIQGVNSQVTDSEVQISMLGKNKP